MGLFGERLKAERKARNLSQVQAANYIGVERGAYGKVERGKTIRPNDWEEYARAFDIPVDEADALINEDAKKSGVPSKVSVPAPTAAPSADRRKSGTPLYISPYGARQLPILGRAAAGEPGKIVGMNETSDVTDCPPDLLKVEGAYALYVTGSSMEPRYFHGELIYVHPRRDPAPGDFCVVQTGPSHDEPESGYIKRFVKWEEDHLRVHQYNPDSDVFFRRDEVVSVHLVVGSWRG